MKKLSVVEAVAFLVGTQIGAGVLGLPHALKNLGFLGILLIAFVGFMTMITAIVVLNFSERIDKSLSGITGDCLGKVGKMVMFLSISILIYGAMIAYISSSGELLNGLVKINKSLASYIFWILFSAIVFFGLKFSGKTEVLLNIILIFAIMTGIVMVFPQWKVQNLSNFQLDKVIPAIGVIAFAFVSHMLVPEILRGVGDKKKAFWSVIWGFLIPMFFYSLFVIAFIGSLGKNTPEIATIVLKEKGNFGKIIGIILPLSAIATSYIGVSFAQMRNIEDFFKTNKMMAWLFTIFPPLVIYQMGLKSFVKALWMGGTFGGILYAGILPVIMYFKCEKNKKPLFSFLVLGAGILFSLVFFSSIKEILTEFIK